MNCAVFVNRQGSQFITGSDDDSIVMWDIVREKTSVRVK